MFVSNCCDECSYWDREEARVLRKPADHPENLSPTTIDGVRVVSISNWLAAVDPDAELSFQDTYSPLSDWLSAYDAIYVAGESARLSIRDAVLQAKETGKTVVLLEGLS